ncbi:hypothetical protein LJC61_04405 [Ruminococcaceae bacterium OttesenSCG-928-A16]|nr:hypothetical protein [Ruminococcaceae bacterium OttesenSCG-928-A16]
MPKQQYQPEQNKTAKPPQSFAYRLLYTVSLLLLLILCVLAGLTAYKQVFGKVADVPRNTDPAPYQTILTAEEQKDWQRKTPLKNQAVCQLNLRIPVQAATGNAQLRLINPPYSAFVCTLQLTLPGKNGQDTTLYQSEKMIPGSVTQHATLQDAATLPKGETQAKATYVFYDGSGMQKGTYSIEVTLVVE